MHRGLSPAPQDGGPGGWPHSGVLRLPLPLPAPLVLGAQNGKLSVVIESRDPPSPLVLGAQNGKLSEA